MDELVNLFQALSDATRLRIVLSLGEGEKNVTTLCEEMSLKQPTMSHHLGLLRMMGLVMPRRNGKQVIYRLAESVDAKGKKGKMNVVFTAGTSTVSIAG